MTPPTRRVFRAALKALPCALAASLLLVACGDSTSASPSSPQRPAAPKPPQSFYRVLEQWSGSEPQIRVVEVRVNGRMVVCIEAREFHSETGSNGPDTAGIGLSCDWSPR